MSHEILQNINQRNVDLMCDEGGRRQQEAVLSASLQIISVSQSLRQAVGAGAGAGGGEQYLCPPGSFISYLPSHRVKKNIVRGPRK